MTGAAPPGATQRLAAFVAELRPEDVPASLVDRLSQCLLDAIGNAGFARWSTDSAGAFLTALDGPDAGGTATVIGDPAGHRPEHAALLNGALIHSLDFDDTNETGYCHPGAPVVPVALAMGELTDGTGRDLLLALAAGYEVCCRVGAALGPGAYDRGFHPTGVAGLFGGVAAGAKCKGLPAGVVAAAFGVASSMASGSMQYLANGAWNKRLQPGLAAQSALLAIALAEGGVHAAIEPLEGENGVLRGYSNTPDTSALTDDLGQRWVAADTAIKPYPSCRLTHGAIDAAVELRSRVPDPARADARIDVRLSPVAHGIVGEPTLNKIAPTNSVEAQFSVYFQAAVALLDGAVPLSSLDRVDDQRVLDLCRRIRVTPDESLRRSAATVAWTPADGGPTVVAQRDVPLGSPSSPLSWDEVVGKTDRLLADVFDDGTRAVLAAAVRTVGEIGSVRDWLAPLRRPLPVGLAT